MSSTSATVSPLSTVTAAPSSVYGVAPAVVVTVGASFVCATVMSRESVLLGRSPVSVAWKLTVRVPVSGVSELFS